MHDNDDDPVGSFLNALQKIDVQIRKKKKTYDRTSRRTGVEINSYNFGWFASYER